MAEMTGEGAVPARATRREWIGLGVLTLAALVYAMDLTVLNLAIPRISAELRPTSAQLLWIIDIYGFLVAGLLDHDGHAGGSDRPPKAPAGRRRGIRARIAAGGLLDELGDAHREPRHHGHRRSDDRARRPSR